MKKSPLEINKINRLTFKWDQKAASVAKIGRSTRLDDGKQRSIDDYLDFLAELEPRKQNIGKAKVFEKPFSLV